MVKVDPRKAKCYFCNPNSSEHRKTRFIIILYKLDNLIYSVGMKWDADDLFPISMRTSTCDQNHNNCKRRAFPSTLVYKKY